MVIKLLFLVDLFTNLVIKVLRLVGMFTRRGCRARISTAKLTNWWRAEPSLNFDLMRPIVDALDTKRCVCIDFE